MKHPYPSAPMMWAKTVGSLTPLEIVYGIRNGLLEYGNSDTKDLSAEPSDALEGSELADCRDVLFRILLLHLHKKWFSIDKPLGALEFLVLDFEDCRTAVVGGGRLTSGIAGIAEGDQQPAELDPEYFERKIRAFRFLTESVVAIVRERVRRDNG
jgi:hypothetical protein